MGGGWRAAGARAAELVARLPHELSESQRRGEPSSVCLLAARAALPCRVFLLRLPLTSLVLEDSGDGIPVKPGHGKWVSGADRYAVPVRSGPL